MAAAIIHSVIHCRRDRHQALAKQKGNIEHKQFAPLRSLFPLHFALFMGFRLDFLDGSICTALVVREEAAAILEEGPCVVS